MSKAERLLRMILGPVRSDIRPLVFAVEIAGDLLFSQHFSMDDIHVTKRIYPDVAKLIQCKPKTASRHIERLAHICWDSIKEQNLISFYLGRDFRQSPDPASLIIYLAIYFHLDIPFFAAIEKYPQLLFQSPSNGELLPNSDTLKAIFRDQPLAVSKVKVFHGLPGFSVCPNCNITLERKYQSFCDRCGQRLNWDSFDQAQLVFPDHSIHT